jgi:hypothetical protein
MAINVIPRWRWGYQPNASRVISSAGVGDLI